MPSITPYTHMVQYQDRKGRWHDGFLVYTRSEAQKVAEAGRTRTGRLVRVVPVPKRVTP